jgi:hypothetical protein
MLLKTLSKESLNGLKWDGEHAKNSILYNGYT